MYKSLTIDLDYVRQKQSSWKHSKEQKTVILLFIVWVLVNTSKLENGYGDLIDRVLNVAKSKEDSGNHLNKITCGQCEAQNAAVVCLINLEIFVSYFFYVDLSRV